MERIPIEIFLHILSFAEHPSLLTRSSCVCKTWRSAIAKNPLCWRPLCLKWMNYNDVESTTDFEKEFLPGSDTNSKWSTLMKELYFELRITLHNIVSVFNQSYHCKLEEVRVRKNKGHTEIKIFIDEQGMGCIQDPAYSILEISNRFRWSSEKLSPASSKFKIQNPDKQYLGYLVYKIPGGLQLGDDVLFTYGFSGYSTVRVLQIANETAEQLQVRHLLSEESYLHILFQ